MRKHHRKQAKPHPPRGKRPTQVIGTAPGTLSIDPEAKFPEMDVFAYGPDRLVEKRLKNVAELYELIDKFPVVWLNVEGLGDVQTIRTIGDLFKLHPLALEDTVSVAQRAKLDYYEQHLFLVARMISLVEGRLDTEQLSLFLGRNFVITLQETPGDCFAPVRERLRKINSTLRQTGPDYLAYTLLDAVVDSYFPALEHYGDRMDALEEEILLGTHKQDVVALHQMKRDLLVLRRAVWPLRDAISSLLREQSPLLTRETQIYLRDCYDHCFQTLDMIETYRELSSGLMEVHLSSISTRINEVMKVLTIISTIFIPLTFIAGVYGMNFHTEKSLWNMPELTWKYGYPLCLGIMFAIAAGLLFYFWRRGWLGKDVPTSGTSSIPVLSSVVIGPLPNGGTSFPSAEARALTRPTPPGQSSSALKTPTK